MSATHPSQTGPSPAPRRDIVVIGASAGGVQVLLDLAAALPAPFPASVLVVLHVGAHRSVLPELMGARGANPVLHPADGQPLRAGTIYVAPPDHHMLVENTLVESRLVENTLAHSGAIRLQRGAKEHHARPAIDPLFRSAALAYGPRVIGVVLSGYLDDGTAGLQAIKRCGGTAVVQDPADAEQPSMPASALHSVEVDHCVPAGRLAQTLVALVGQPLVASRPAVPMELIREQAISTGVGNQMEHLNAIGKPSTFACPDCDGVLWEIAGTQPKRYRCHTGHGFSLRSLVYTQALNTDHALWGAVRALQEREVLLRALVDSGGSADEDATLSVLAAQAERTAQQALQLQQMVVAS